MTFQTIAPLPGTRSIGGAWLSPFGISCLCSLATLIVLVLTTNSGVDFESFVEIIWPLAVLAVLRVVYTWLRPDPLISSLTGGALGLAWSGLVSGLIALTGLRLHAPLIDAEIAQADALFHVNTPAIVAWTALHPAMGNILNVVYVSTLPVVFLSVVILTLTRRDRQMRELVFTFSTCGAICAGLSAIIPAAGAFTYYSTGPDTIARLPAGAGTFYLAIFNGYRSGTISLIDMHNLEGVVTFPSFHACMALMVAYAFRGLRGLSALAWLWCGSVLLSTIPIGGHYAADLLAGAAIWSAFPFFFRWNRRRLAHGLSWSTEVATPFCRPRVTAL